jgi:hypothetical protein
VISVNPKNVGFGDKYYGFFGKEPTRFEQDSDLYWPN